MRLVGDLARGAGYVAIGWRLALQPSVRALVIAPIVIGFVVYAAAAAYLLPLGWQWLQGAVADFPEWFHTWLGFLVPLVGFILGALAVLLLGWLTMLATMALASPFYGVLATRVEEQLTGRRSALERSVAREALAAIAREGAKMAWYLPRLVVILLLQLIPALNLIAAPLAFAFAAWVLAIQFCDYLTENRGEPLAATRATLRARPGLTLGFGAVVALGLGVPLLNLLLAPAAVAGGAALLLNARNEWAPGDPATGRP